MSVLDRFGRRLGTLRISVTDRCNLRCQYCMPEREYAWLPKADILRFEELTRLARAFVSLGVKKLRLTGGEPLLRANLPELIVQLKALPGLEEIALTTNGVLLADQAASLVRAGLGRITVSLDTLKEERFFQLTRRSGLAEVERGLAAAAAQPGLGPLKIDTVLLRGVNEDELFDLVEYAGRVPAEIRFIEYMDVGGATTWRAEDVVTRAEILERLSARYGLIEPLPADDGAPAERFRLPGGQTLGIIASVTQPFCKTCDRARLTADGTWYLCLYAERGHDLRALIRGGASDEELLEFIARAWSLRDDRGAEARVGLVDRAPLVTLRALRSDPRLEMHSRGG